MIYDLSENFTAITEKEGTLQNLSKYSTIEVAIDTTKGGLLIEAGEKLNFKIESTETLHAKIKFLGMCEAGGEKIAVVNLKKTASGNSGTSSTIDDTVIATDKTWSSQKISDEIANHSSRSGTSYIQATKLGITATTDNPEIIDLPITQTTTFCLPPVEILKNNLVTESSVIKNEAVNFKTNNNYVIGDVIKLKTDHVVAMPTTAFGNQYLSESDEIDFKIIERIEVL